MVAPRAGGTSASGTARDPFLQDSGGAVWIRPALREVGGQGGIAFQQARRASSQPLDRQALDLPEQACRPTALELARGAQEGSMCLDRVPELGDARALRGRRHD